MCTTWVPGAPGGQKNTSDPATGVADGFKLLECGPAIQLGLRLSMKPAWPQPYDLLPCFSGHWCYRFVL